MAKAVIAKLLAIRLEWMRDFPRKRGTPRPNPPAGVKVPNSHVYYRPGPTGCVERPIGACGQGLLWFKTRAIWRIVAVGNVEKQVPQATAQVIENCTPYGSRPVYSPMHKGGSLRPGLGAVAL